MLAPSTSKSRAESRGRAGRSAIRSAGRSKSKSATRISRDALASEIGLHNFRRIGGRLAGLDPVDHVHSADDAPDHRVIAVQARVWNEHDEELAVGRVRIIGPCRADGSAKEGYGGELGFQVGQV